MQNHSVVVIPMPTEVVRPGRFRPRPARGLVFALTLLTPWSPLAHPSRPGLYRIDLTPTVAEAGLKGVAILSQPRSPFGLAMTPDGHFRFRVAVSANELPPPSTFGAGLTSYVVWVAQDNLDEVTKIGVLTPGKPTFGEFAYNKYIVIVTAESSSGGDRWKGPIVLKGFSASSYLVNFSGHTMFNGGMPQ